MQQDQDERIAPQRTTPRHVVEKRNAAALAKPYSRPMAEWQMRFARLRAQKVAAHSTVDDQLQAILGLGELAQEVAKARQEFELAISHGPVSGAVLDLRKALQRLSEQVTAELR